MFQGLVVNDTRRKNTETSLKRLEIHKNIQKLLSNKSDSSDNSDIDDTDIDAECKMNAVSSSAEKKIEFNIDKWYDLYFFAIHFTYTP